MFTHIDESRAMELSERAGNESEMLHTPVGVKSWVWKYFGFRKTDGAVVRDVAVCLIALYCNARFTHTPFAVRMRCVFFPYPC